MMFICAILVLAMPVQSSAFIENEATPQQCWVDILNITRDLVKTEIELAGSLDILRKNCLKSVLKTVKKCFATSKNNKWWSLLKCHCNF